MDELERLRQENQKLKKENAQLKELVETIAEINRSNEIGIYIKEKKRAIALAQLINKTSSAVAVSISQQEKEYNQAVEEKAALDKKIVDNTGISMQEIQNQMDSLSIENQFTYKETKNGIEIVSYIGGENEVEIPKIIKGKNVTSIGKQAFRGKNVSQVNLPDTIGSIKEEAFIGCKHLEVINLPESIDYMGEYCFALTGLKKIEVPQKILKIPRYCFSECRNLKSVRLQEGLRCIGKCAFAGTRLRQLTIPLSVSVIEQNAFSETGSKTSKTQLTFLRKLKYTEEWLGNVTVEQKK